VNAPAGAPQQQVLVCNLGSPAAPTAAGVRAFLAEFLSDPLVVDLPRWLWQPILRGIVLRRRPARVARLYEEIWTDEGSPLAAGTARLARALGERLGAGFRVRPVYRYGAPSLQAELEACASRGEPVHVVPLFPQRTGSSHGTIAQLVQRSGGRARTLDLDADDPGYVAALAAQHGRTDGAATAQHLVISFHGIPVRHDRRERGRYRADCEATARALVRALELRPEQVALTFQSRFGFDRWLGPATDATVVDLARRGVRDVALISPGFLTEGLETLAELDVELRRRFTAAGGRRLIRVPAVGDEPAFVSALAARIRAAVTVP
jgi:ferrochelatase